MAGGGIGGFEGLAHQITSSAALSTPGLLLQKNSIRKPSLRERPGALEISQTRERSRSERLEHPHSPREEG